MGYLVDHNVPGGYTALVAPDALFNLVVIQPWWLLMLYSTWRLSGDFIQLARMSGGFNYGLLFELTKPRTIRGVPFAYQRTLNSC